MNIVDFSIVFPIKIKYLIDDKNLNILYGKGLG